MALIKCRECGHMVSDKAERCPKCGCPIITEKTAWQNAGMNNPHANYQPAYHNKDNKNKWLYAIIALLVAALAGGGFYFYNQNKQQEEDFQQKLHSDSIARDSIGKANDIRLDSIEQANSKSQAKTQQTQQTQPTVTAAPQYYGQVSDPDGYTNIRRGPGTNYTIVRQYSSGDYLYYTPQKNGWSLVYSGVKANTFMGYMHTSRIVRIDPNSGSSYSSSGSSYSSSGGNYHEGYIVDPVDDYVNIRKGPGTNYSIVGRLDTYTDVYYTTTGSNWYKVYDGNYNYLGYVYYNRIKKTR